MMNIAELEQNLEVVDNSIRELSEKRHNLCQQLKQAKEQDCVERFKRWGIDNGSYVLMFAKAPNEEYYLIKTFAVTSDIDIESMYIRGILSNYNGTVKLKNYSVCNDAVTFSSLETIEKEYSVYIVDKDTFNSFQTRMCNLDIDVDNVDKFEKKVSDAAITQIS